VNELKLKKQSEINEILNAICNKSGTISDIIIVYNDDINGINYICSTIDKARFCGYLEVAKILMMKLDE
jgi:hypothetical protein